MKHCCQTTFFKHIKVIVTGSAVSAETNADAFFQHFIYRSNTARQFQVTLGVMSNAHIFRSHNVHIFISKMNSVSSDGAKFEHTQFIHHHNGSNAVFFNIVLYFDLSFAKVHLNFYIIFFSSSDYSFKVINRASIRSVRAKSNTNTTIVVTVPIFCELNVFRKLIVFIRSKTNQTTAKVSTNTGFCTSFSNIIHKVVHICKTGSTAFEHFCDAEHCAPVNIFSTHLSFKGPNFILQPIHQRHIICIAAEQGHGNVTVGIYHTCGSKLTCTVEYFRIFESSRNFGTNINDFFVFNSDVIHFSVRSVEQFHIFYQEFAH